MKMGSRNKKRPADIGVSEELTRREAEFRPASQASMLTDTNQTGKRRWKFAFNCGFSNDLQFSPRQVENFVGFSTINWVPRG